MRIYVNFGLALSRRGDKWALMESSFTNNTSKCGHIPGSLAFSEFFLAKKNVPPAKSPFENTIGNTFFGTPLFGTKRFKKKLQPLFYSPLTKNCFWIWSRTLGSAQIRNHTKYAVKDSMVFFKAFLRTQVGKEGIALLPILEETL